MSACLGKTVALPTEEVLSFSVGGLALHRIGRLGVSAGLSKTTALSSEEVLSVGLIGNCSTSTPYVTMMFIGFGGALTGSCVVTTYFLLDIFPH